jgi:hypothetical protein
MDLIKPQQFIWIYYGLKDIDKNHQNHVGEKNKSSKNDKLTIFTFGSSTPIDFSNDLQRRNKKKLKSKCWSQKLLFLVNYYGST